MSADRFDTKAVRDLLHHLNRIAASAERIADALEKMNENDPLTAINAAMEASMDPATSDLNPENKPCPQCGGMLVADTFPDGNTRFLRCTGCDWRNYQVQQPAYGADLPESERWRLGQS